MDSSAARDNCERPKNREAGKETMHSSNTSSCVAPKRDLALAAGHGMKRV